MKRALKTLAYTLLSLLIIAIIFFFWASAPQYNASTYQKTITNQHPTSYANDSLFTIATYNIGYLSGMTNNQSVEIPKSLVQSNLNHVKQQFIKLNADVIAFQEIDYNANRSFYINQQDEIAKLGYNHVAQAVNWDKRYLPFPYWPIHLQYGSILSGQSVLSKYPIKKHQRIVLDRDQTNPFYYDAFYIDRLAQVVTVEIKNKTVIVINVHLEAFHQETRRIHTQRVIELYKQYHTDYPTILLGDFNSDAAFENATIQDILDIPKIGNAVYTNGTPKTYSSRQPTERLDYIFYNKEMIELIDAEVLNDFGEASDHLPVMMQFKLK